MTDKHEPLIPYIDMALDPASWNCVHGPLLSPPDGSELVERCPAVPASKLVEIRDQLEALTRDRNKHRAVAEALEHELDQLKLIHQLVMHLLQTPASDFWIWMDDDNNHLESMVDSLAIRITARQLRELLEKSGG